MGFPLRRIYSVAMLGGGGSANSGVKRNYWLHAQFGFVRRRVNLLNFARISMCRRSVQHVRLTLDKYGMIGFCVGSS